jgi:hypothetical protein
MKSSGASVVAVATGFIGGAFTFGAIREPAGSILATWAWRAGMWVIGQLSLPTPIPSAPAFVCAIAVGLLCAAVAHLLFWRLELWAAGKDSEDAQQVLRRPCGALAEKLGVWSSWSKLAEVCQETSRKWD